MSTKEEKVVNAILKYRNFLFLILVSVIALIMRLKLFSFQSYDFRIFLLPWYETIEKLGGIKALNTQVGNYGITYKTLIQGFEIPRYQCFQKVYDHEKSTEGHKRGKSDIKIINQTAELLSGLFCYMQVDLPRDR